jgi:hypothetical protein
MGQLWPIAGEPIVVTMSLPSRLIAPPPPVSWPNVVVLVSMVETKVAHVPCANEEPLLSASVPLASIRIVP